MPYFLTWNYNQRKNKVMCMNKETIDIKKYIYLDEEDIDSLYSQLTNEVVVEERINNVNGGTLKAKIGVVGKIKGLFGIDTSVDNKFIDNNQHEKKIKYSYEQKLGMIINKVSNSNNYCTSMEEAKQKCTNNSSLTFINFCDIFYSRLDFTSYQVFEYIQKCGYIEFERGDSPISQSTLIKYNIPYDTYTYSDDYYQKSKYRVVMSMNLEKMRTSYGGMTSHLAIALRGGKGRIKFGVFGQIRNINDFYFQIKPFAVWW